MPFVSFALPLFKPRRWDAVALGVLIVVMFLLDRGLGLQLADSLSVERGLTLSQPWRLLGYALIQPNAWNVVGVAVAVPVGLTMATRTCGSVAGWVGVVGGTLIGALLAHFFGGEAGRLTGAAALLYTSLGMGAVAWFRVRDELTYRGRVDWVVGFGTLALVALALVFPLVRQLAFRPEYAVTTVFGALLMTFWPRHWESVMR